MIPSDPEDLKKARELAARNIANGDWGEETTIPGLGETVAVSVEEHVRRGTISHALSKFGGRIILKRKP